MEEVDQVIRQAEAFKPESRLRDYRAIYVCADGRQIWGRIDFVRREPDTIIFKTSMIPDGKLQITGFRLLTPKDELVAQKQMPPVFADIGDTISFTYTLSALRKG